MRLRLSRFKILKPLRTKNDYGAALRFVQRFFYAKKGTREADLVEILAILIEKYEEEHFPIGIPDPIGAIKFRMEQLGMRNKDLGEVIGGRNRVSEVLRRKRGLSLEMIRSLHKKLHIPTEVLIG